MTPKDHQAKVRSRVSHRKSRLGCGNCKKRRVKCDEIKPSCTNCLQHSITCDFSLSSSASPSEASAPQQRFQFRESKYQSLTSPKEDEPNQRSIGVQCDPAPSPTATSSIESGGISLSDLHLFHHYTTSTYRTLADEATDTNRVNQVHIPQWGMTFPPIMHLVLALSALHLAFLDPDKQEEYTRQADEHFTFGVRSVTTVLALDTLASENCQQIYMSAVLICFAYFAHGPRQGEFLVFNQNGRSEWLVLLHGVRAITAQKHSEIFTGVLEPTARRPTSSDPAPGHEDEIARHKMRLREIRTLVDKEVSLDKAAYVKALDDLIESFEHACEHRRLGGYVTELMPFTMGWTFRLPEIMIQKLEEKEPVALVILGHWAILMRYMRGVWFMRGWDEHIIRGIRACLPLAYHGWLEWPEEVILFDRE
ncbi:hypothetical protein BJY04DRAFT_185051 [Aspergillus karnatakaensis]|uniref:Zn(II)2Cys6 transcription factor n=1 Tax=Aspergillus karnatakaensis TaxID=1810916 RepID=UPI003CCE5176